jgi:serine/threonine-protein kinase
MIAGRQPFEGKTALDLMAAVINRQPVSLSTSGKAVPPLLEKIVFKALEKEQEKRYQNTAEVLTDLNECGSELASTSNVDRVSNQSQAEVHLSAPTLSELDASKRSGTTNVQTSTRTGDALGDVTKAELANSRTRKRLVIGGLIALLLIVGGIVYWQYFRGLAPIESIAVLPFKNETNNSDLDWLSDGMPESLINSLSQIPNLSVKSRSSVFRYKGQEVDPQKVAKDLSVQAVLEGRVVQHGNDLTISLSLVDGSSGNQIWGEQYVRTKAEIVTLQSEIARDVSSKLRIRLSGEAQKRIAKDYTANSEAYQLYLKGRIHVFRITPDEIQQGMELFQQAIKLDPNYAPAYVGLAEANRSLAIGSERNPAEYLPRAKDAAQIALTLDEELAEAHTALGAAIFWYERNWEESEKQYKRALELNTNQPDAHLFYAHQLAVTGHFEEALAHIKRARELDPTSTFVSTIEGQFLVDAGRFDEAIARLKDAIAITPNFWFPHLFLAEAYFKKEMYADAIVEAHKASELSKAQTVSLAFEAAMLAKIGRSDEARAILNQLLNLSKQRDRWIPPYHVALVYNALGNSDEAITWLNKAIDAHDPKIAFLKIETRWDNLRSDLRFQEIMKRANF